MDWWDTVIKPIIARTAAALIVGSITAIIVAAAIKFITWLF